MPQQTKNSAALTLAYQRLLEQGANRLTTMELLTIFIGEDNIAVDISKPYSLGFLLNADYSTLYAAYGMQLPHYLQLKVMQELVLRTFHEALQGKDIFSSPLIVEQFLLGKLRYQQREIFACLLLNNKHCLLAYEELFFGSINSATVHPREIIKCALHYNAAAMILVHNHPSGDVHPSQADHEITKTLKRSLRYLEIRLLDHMIVGAGSIFSFVQQGLL